MTHNYAYKMACSLQMSYWYAEVSYQLVAWSHMTHDLPSFTHHRLFLLSFFGHTRGRPGMGAENSIVGSADDWCVAAGTAHLTAPSSSPPINIAAITHDALLLMQPSVLCTITLTDAFSTIRYNWHINMQKLNGLTFFRSNEDLVPQLGREIYIYKAEEGHADTSFA